MTKVYVPFCVINCCEFSEEAIKKGTNFFGWGMLYAIVLVAFYIIMKEKNSMEKPWYLLIPVPFVLIPGILQLFMTCESNPNRSDSSPFENHSSQGPPHSMDMPASSGWQTSSETPPPKLDAFDDIDSKSHPSLHNEDKSHTEEVKDMSTSKHNSTYMQSSIFEELKNSKV